MPDFLKSIILGIIQGLTEFLPVSSSGHLELAKSILGLNLEDGQSLALTVWLHLATALSTIVFFRRDIAKLIKNGLNFSVQSEGKSARNYIVFIIISMIPAGVIGLLFEDKIDEWFYGNIAAVSICLLFTGLLLYWSQKKEGKGGEITAKKSGIIGIAQAIALLPGISRSGATIAMSLILGVKREEAAKFSFLMVLPLILAKVAKDVLEALLADDFASLHLDLNTLLGFIFAFATGLAACKWMITLVKNLKLNGFAIYCALVGLAGIVFSFVV